MAANHYATLNRKSRASSRAVLRRGEGFDTAGGGKGGATGSYDPQVQAAAQMQAQTAQQAEAFSEKYYTQYMQPLLQQMTAATAQNTAQQSNLYNIQEPQVAAAANEYQKYGIPAQTNYYNMVDQYSAPAYQETQAATALGDQRAAEAANYGTFKRNLGQAGISLNSPAAISAMSDMAVRNAANEANAETQARTAARNLGMQLKSDATNVASGNASQTVALGGGASAASNSSAATTQTGVTSGTNGASVGLSGIQTALQGYTNQMNAYSNLDSSSINASAQSASGLGSGLGAIIGSVAAAKKTPWFLGG